MAESKDTTSPTIDPEFQRLVPPLTASELGGLRESLLAEGCRDALIVWNGVMIDGHNRLALCTELGIPFRVIEYSFASRRAARIWIRDNAMARRSLTDDQRAALQVDQEADMVAESKTTRARKAGKVGGKTGGRHHPKSSGLATAPSAKPEKPPRDRAKDVRSKAAKAAKVSERKMRTAKKVKKSRPDLFAAVLDDEMSLAEATRIIARAEVVAKLDDTDTRDAKVAQGVYDVIVVDPPWPMRKIERDERPNQVGSLDYHTMTLDEIRAWALPAADDCHVWLWTTHRFLPDAFDVLRAWGLAYVCAFVWHKPGGFQPVGLPQYNCEFALYARKGHPVFIETTAFPVCLNADRTKHSEKPDAFYDIVRRVTGGRRLDLFNRRLIDGFDGAGREAK